MGHKGYKLADKMGRQRPCGCLARAVITVNKANNWLC